MGDDQRSAAGENGVQRVLHQPLGGRIERRRGLVEYDDRRVGEDDTRERDQLALTGGEPGAVLADVGVVAALQSLHHLVEANGLGRGLDLGI